MRILTVDVHIDGLVRFETFGKLRQCSHLVHGYNARVRYSLDTNVNTRFYQVSTSELIRVVGARGQGRDLIHWHTVFVCSGVIYCYLLELAFQNGVSQRAKRSK